MKNLILGSLSVLAISIATVPAAEAFTSVTDSGVADANYDNHEFDLKVKSNSLTGLNIVMPEQVREIDEVQIFNQEGELIPVDITMNDRSIAIQFEQPINPGNELNLEFRGVDGSYRRGNTLSYDVSVQKEGLSQTIPLRAATVRIPDTNS